MKTVFSVSETFDNPQHVSLRTDLVDKVEWLGSPVNIKGARKDAKI